MDRPLTKLSETSYSTPASVPQVRLDYRTVPIGTIAIWRRLGPYWKDWRRSSIDTLNDGESVLKFAIAPCCWGVYWPTGNEITWDAYLGKITEAGYRSTELGPYGFGPTDPNELSKSLAAFGVDLVAAAHVHTLGDITSVALLERSAHSICELLASQGHPQFILMDESEFYPKDKMGVIDESQKKTVVEQTTKAAEIAKSYGLSFALHPHVGTCVETETQIEWLLANTDPALVGLCLDTGHHAYWMQDPLVFLENHRSRINSIHLKNIDPDIRQRVHNDGIHSDEAFEIGIMTGLDAGAVDINAFVAELAKSGFDGPIVVEQDLFEANPRSPEVIAKHNLNFLNTVAVKAGNR
jgi:inosose dehydratase